MANSGDYPTPLEQLSTTGYEGPGCNGWFKSNDQFFIFIHFDNWCSEEHRANSSNFRDRKRVPIGKCFQQRSRRRRASLNGA